MGNFRSLPKVVGGRWGKSHYRGKMVKVTRNPKHGYGQLSLVGEWKKKTVRAHRVVAEAFIPNPSNKPYINHIDCDKLNNSIENLEWVTAKENTEHISKLGRFNPLRGSASTSAKLIEDDILGMRLLKKAGMRNFEIAHIYRVSQSTVGDILKRKTWRHV